MKQEGTPMHAHAATSTGPCPCPCRERQAEELRKWAAECKERFPGHPGFAPDFPGQTPRGQALALALEQALAPADLAAMEALLAPAAAATRAGGSFAPATVELADGHQVEIAMAQGSPGGTLVLHARSRSYMSRQAGE
jgi:hypothetical protein